ncbi:DUF6602 domain-containing protein [Psychrobacter glaciei]|uniref:DUF6602 domain-containing protein n=1 Tax=Psychrobacter glaciei TaxID=619771 RepID=UPI001F06D8A6|nr:DUF6602 domain-containing protein [Psychrobacter glaciei]MCH1782042.1 hypothetical protein [Psychrobacter glaciei]
MSNIELPKLFKGMQDQMKAQLNTNRSFIEHPGSKGDALENAWIEWLRSYLPNRYSIDKAIIIDHHGNTSHQIDIVIYDNYFTPFIFSQNGFHYIPAEGVYAVFEVKPDIYGNIEYAGEKIASVRALDRTSTSMISSGNLLSARPLTKIVGGILATSNSYKQNKTVEGNISKLKGLQTIDLGCSVETGSFSVDYNGEENPKENDFSKRINEYYEARVFNKLNFSKPENSLITFFMQLTRYLQQAIGTIPAIDLQAYLNVIGEEIDQEL